MKLTNQFTVSADPETVWSTLLDMEGVAGCLPGATITATDEEDTYEGSMRVKIGPMTVSYQGTATLTEVDQDARRAVISLRAREARGQGTAMATITNAVEPAEAGTRVTAETDLHVTGAQARFGRGVMEDVAGRVLDEFSSRLERKLAGESEPAEPGDGGPPAEPRDAAAPPAPSPDEALDMGAVMADSPIVRYARTAAPVVGLLLVLAFLLRRRR
jgi:carbon monoxide dehydrogenase subunit G